MKKLIPILLTLLLLVGLMPTAAFAAAPEEYSETIEFVESGFVETEHFRLTTSRFDSDGWWGGENYPLTIEARVNGVTITRIESTIGWFAQYYDSIVFDNGTKEPVIRLSNGKTISVTKINASSISVIDGGNVEFKGFTVYYTVAGEAPVEAEGSVLSQGSIWIIIAVAVIAVGTVSVLIVRKKKKS